MLTAGINNVEWWTRLALESFSPTLSIESSLILILGSLILSILLVLVARSPAVKVCSVLVGFLALFSMGALGWFFRGAGPRAGEDAGAIETFFITFVSNDLAFFLSLGLAGVALGFGAYLTCRRSARRSTLAP